MRIGEIAEQADVSTKTIRYYESIGLIAEPDRTPSGYRDYTNDAITRLRFIRDAQASGLSLMDIQAVLELKDDGRPTCEHTEALLRRRLEELDCQIERMMATRQQLAGLAARAESLDHTECRDPHRCHVITSEWGDAP